MASIVATIWATWWQVNVTREIDSNNATQQQKVEVDLRERHAATEGLLKQQLEAQEKLIQQQAQSAEQLQEIVRSLQKVMTPKK